MKLIAAAVLLFTLPTFAVTNFLCSGKHQSKSVVLKGSIEDLANINTGLGSVSVDGREVAEFEGRDAKINYIFLSAKLKNSRGELLEGRVTDLPNGKGLITRLSVPGFGIDYRNVPVTCLEVP